MTISKRKSEHVRIALEEDVRFREKTTGFDSYAFIHCALPEMDFEDASTEAQFLGKSLSLPLMISAMTGGAAELEEINENLAEVCRRKGIALGLGSQRQMLEQDAHLDSYRIVRKSYPEGIVIGNIGAAQVAAMEDLSPVQRMVDAVEADALAVHCNPLQERLQPEGDDRFSGVLSSLARLVEVLTVPVIVKEVGCGISDEVARKLVNAGVAWIDVAGAGGTSWVGVESHRDADKAMCDRFWDWGIPTAECLEMVSKVPGARMIASGGIRDGVMMAKAIALGAELCGAALPFLRVLLQPQKFVLEPVTSNRINRAKRFIH